MSPRDLKAAERAYRVVHWGRGGKYQPLVSSAADPAFGVATELGPLVAVVYAARKGLGGKLEHWEHEFSAKNRPLLAYNDGGLLIVGGGYHVSWRGIVG